jgi:hypothetical protein
MANPTASEQLSAYLDGELTDTERTELEHQLAGDPALREELQELEQAIDFLRTHGPVQAPPEFHLRVLDAVKHEPMPGTWWRWLRRPFGLPVEGFAVALAAALVLLIALPFGTDTGRQAMRDLVGDPYGFVKSEDARSVPAAPATTETRLRKTAAAPSEEEGRADVIADAGEDKKAPQPPPPPRKEVQAKAPAKPAPTAKEQKAVRDTGPAVATGADPAFGEETEVSIEPKGTGEATQEPASPAPTTQPTMVGVTYRYDVLTYDVDALLKLQRIAGRYRGGQVLDERGVAVSGSDLKSGGTYYVEIPTSVLAEFGDALRKIGMVEEIPDDRIYAGDQVRVQVTFRLLPTGRSDGYDEALEDLPPDLPASVPAQ